MDKHQLARAHVAARRTNRFAYGACEPSRRMTRQDALVGFVLAFFRVVIHGHEPQMDEIREQDRADE